MPSHYQTSFAVLRVRDCSSSYSPAIEGRGRRVIGACRTLADTESQCLHPLRLLMFDGDCRRCHVSGLAFLELAGERNQQAISGCTRMTLTTQSGLNSHCPSSER